MKKYVNEVEDNNETLIIKRGKGQGTVLISLAEYNSMLETMHFLGSIKNADRLYESMKEIKSQSTAVLDF